MKRNNGIDAARIWAMFGVVVMHNLGQGGILNHQALTGGNWVSAYWLENLAYVAVNVFAMITGYLWIDRQIKFKRVFDVFIQAFFWATVIKLGLKGLGYSVALRREVFTSYWYVNAYIGLMIIAPILNAGLAQMSDRQYGRLAMANLLVGITLGMNGNWGVNYGYSVYWLLTMYLVGGLIKRMKQVKLSQPLLLGIWLVSAATSLRHEWRNSQAGLEGMIGINYNSLAVVIGSIALLLFCLQWQLKPRRWRRHLANSAFAVYLLDTSALFTNILPGRFAGFVEAPLGALVGGVLIISVAMYLVFTGLEMIRRWLFARLGIDHGLEFIWLRLQQVGDKCLAMSVEPKSRDNLRD